MKAKQHGFTLIEVMIVVAILSILALVAWPGYVEHVRKGVRRAAQSQMMELANREQQFLLSNRTYVDYPTIVASGYTLPTDLQNKYTPSITVVASPPSYTITFTAINNQAVDGNLSLTSDGTKSPPDKW